MGPVAFSAPRPLQDSDDITGFACGVELIDAWVAKHARKARTMGTAVVYVSCCEGVLAGFYTLSSQSIAREGLHGWMARNAPAQIPVILLGMFGVDKHYQGQGLGHDLLLDAVRRAQNVAAQIGAKALVVDPYDDAARSFYARYGFRPLPGTSHLYAKLG